MVLGVIILLGTVDLTPYLNPTKEKKITETFPIQEKVETDSQRLASSKQLVLQIEKGEPNSREIESKPRITPAPKAQLSINEQRSVQTPQAMQLQPTQQPEKDESPKSQIEIATDIGAKTEPQPAPAQEQKPAETETTIIKPAPKTAETDQTGSISRQRDSAEYPFSILLGAFSNLDTVKNVQKTYRDKGIIVFWVKANLGEKGILYRVFAGSFQSRVKAESFQRQHNLTDKIIKPTRYAALIGIFSSKTEINNHLQKLLEMNYSPYVISRGANHHYLYVGAYYKTAEAINQCRELNKNEITCQAVVRSSGAQSAMSSTSFTGSSKTAPKRKYPYSILLGTYSTIKLVMEGLQQYKTIGLQAYWVKIDLGSKGIFFRLFTGQFTTRNDAVAFLRNHKLPEALIKLTRYACLVGTFTSKSEVDHAAVSIFEKRYHPYSIQLSDNQYRLYVGTFYTQIGAQNFCKELAANGFNCEAVER